jgi:hypothetical protein
MKQRVIIAAAVVVVAAAAVFIMMSRDSKPSTFVVSGGNLEIKGSFGTTLPIDGISSLELKDSIPAVTSKDNGSGLGSKCKGSFTLEGGIKARLYADTSKPPFVYFVQDGIAYYLNSDTQQKTQELFDQLKAIVK